MRTLLQVIVAGSILIAMPVVANDQHDHSERKSSETPAAKKAASARKDEAMKVNMDQMRKQMDEIRQTKDPKSREHLMQDHMKLMKEQMGMMKGAQRAGVTGVNPESGLKELIERDKAMTARRMDMLEEMLDQILFQQETIMLQMRQGR